MSIKGILAGLAGFSILAAVVGTGVWLHARAPKQAELHPISMIAVKDCGHLLGVLVVDQTGEIHNMPGPFTPDVLAGLKALAATVPSQDKGRATIDMPCHADSGQQDGGKDT